MDLNHHRTGSGSPLVLLHGVGHHWHTWGPVIPGLVQRFEVIAVDSPGFGASPPLPAGVDPTIDAYADAFIEWFDEQGLDAPYVAGNSMGGAIALELARRGRVRGVTAISPAGFWNDRERRYCQRSLGLVARMPSVVHAPMMALVGSPAVRTLLISNLFARPWRVPAADLRLALGAAWAAPAFTPALEAFDRYRFSAARARDLQGQRITVAWGTRDRLLPYSRQAPRARALLGDARHVALPGLGHVPFYDDPGMVVELLTRAAL